MSELVAYAMIWKSRLKRKKIVDSKEAILDSLADMLEKMLTLDLNWSAQRNWILFIYLIK